MSLGAHVYSGMMTVLNFLFRFWFYLKTYIVGAWFLLKQILTPHRKPQDIQLQTGKVAIVTGGDSGIGFHVAKGLVAKNVHVIIACRYKEKGIMAIDEIRKDFPNAKVDCMELDLSSLQSVRDFVDRFLARDLSLHLLINNAGIMFAPYEVTEDGFESQFQVNYLSHLNLTWLLQEKLIDSGADNCWSRVVNVSSCMHCIGTPDLSSVMGRSDGESSYCSHKAYADSKLLIIIAAKCLDKMFRNTNSPVSVSSVHPGVVISGLWKNIHWLHHKLIFGLFSWAFLSPEQGADTVLYAALSHEGEGQGHGYFSNSSLSEAVKITNDESIQVELWTDSFMLIDKTSSPD